MNTNEALKTVVGGAQAHNVIRGRNEARKVLKNTDATRYSPEDYEALREIEGRLAVVRGHVEGPVSRLQREKAEREENHYLPPDPEAEALLAALRGIDGELYDLLVNVRLRIAEATLALADERLPGLEARVAKLQPKLAPAKEKADAAQAAYAALLEEYRPAKSEMDRLVEQRQASEQKIENLRPMAEFLNVS